MIKHEFSDGSVGYEYERGDLVRFIKSDNNWSSPKVGEWGRVYQVDRGNSYHTRFLSIQMEGYSRKRGCFVSNSGSTPPWNVRPFKLEKYLTRGV